MDSSSYPLHINLFLGSSPQKPTTVRPTVQTGFSDDYNNFLEKISQSTGNWSHPPTKSNSQPTSPPPSNEVKDEDNKDNIIKTEPDNLDNTHNHTSIASSLGGPPPGAGAGFAAVQAMASVDRQLHGSAGMNSGEIGMTRPKLEPGVSASPDTQTRPTSALERQLALPPVQQFLGLPLPAGRRPSSTPPAKVNCVGTPPLLENNQTPPPAHRPISTGSVMQSLLSESVTAAGRIGVHSPLSLPALVSAGPPSSLTSQTMLAWSSGPAIESSKTGLLGLATHAAMSPGGITAGSGSALASVRHLISLPPTPSPTPSIEMVSSTSVFLGKTSTSATPPLQALTPPQPVMSPLSVPSPHRPLLISPPPYMSPSVLTRTPPGTGLLAVAPRAPTPQSGPTTPGLPQPKPRRRSRSRSQTPQSRSHTPQSARSHTPQSLPASTPPLPVTPSTGIKPGNMVLPGYPGYVGPTSPGVSSCASGSICSSPPPETSSKTEDGRISPVVDALIARIKAKTKVNQHNK